MSDANILIILSIFFPLFLVTASEDKGALEIQEVGQFRPHMLDHPFKGCPTNSLCSETMGSKRKGWLKAIRSPKPSVANTFLKTHGMPVKIWSRDKVLKDPALITWDSFCSKHNPKPSSEGLINTDQKIYISEIFAKNLSSIEKLYKEDSQIMMNRLYLLDKKKVVSYLIPRSEAPLFIDNKDLYFTIEEEGSYFGLTISPSGSLKVIATSLPKNFPDEIKCPEALSKAFQAGITNKELYEGYFCKALWDRSKKAYTTVAIGWSCN
jgi:hypothetical protein